MVNSAAGKALKNWLTRAEYVIPVESLLNAAVNLQLLRLPAEAKKDQAIYT